MKNIELVIKVPEDLYEAYKGRPPMLGDAGMDMIAQSIANGTPLPKGHGRLGDLDALRDEVSSWGMNDYEPSDFIDEIDRADVIVEADKAESEE